MAMTCSSLQGSNLLLHFSSKNLGFNPTVYSNLTTTTTTTDTSKTSSSRIPLSTSRSTKTRVSVFSSSTDDLRPELDENPEGILSGEWPDNFSLLSYDDVRAYLETQIKPSSLLGEVMSTEIRWATADQTLEEIDHYFEVVSGLPVVDGDLRCIGVVSKKDKAKASRGLNSTVGEVMSSPAITLTPDKTVMDAAALMLKMKVHRIPILNEERHVVGMVTRTDIFQALEALVVV